ncbi:MAG TPA: hypothetical protein VN256_11715 [Pyrinomonadaceae bacterium]|nr:hypothetical protein [Pyrinomonadaceae bacterium]
MKRRVLAIPKEELDGQFAENARQDVKVVAPSILTNESFRKFAELGRDVKAEEPLEGFHWKHSEAEEPNRLCEAGDFADDYLWQDVNGPFSISFANEHAAQDAHYHKRHFEIYYSDHPMSAEFRHLEDPQPQPPIELKHGGLILFGPNVVHKMRLGGLTVVIEVASVDDKFKEKL